MAIIDNVFEEPARSLQAIQDSVDASAIDYIPELNTSNKVGVFGKIKALVSYLIWQTEQAQVLAKNRVYDAVINQVVCTEGWYVAKILAFQYGDYLQWNGYTMQYQNIHPERRIVKFCSCRSGGNGSVIIKYATDGGNGVIQPLSAQQETALLSYIQQIKYAGLKVSASNAVPDSIKLTMSINDWTSVSNSTPLDLNTGTGAIVKTAIDNFFKKLAIDGIFRTSDLERYLIETLKCRFVVINTTHFKASGAANYTAFIGSIYTTGGYFQLDAGNSTITLVN